jgi:hypothetical protein
MVETHRASMLLGLTLTPKSLLEQYGTKQGLIRNIVWDECDMHVELVQ